ncbi:unnamed protein product [Brachionus calyciflorus]|uniref:Tc1-like transposase DDE domain-containing protein n=1 Tax=Brachionus calyciflorus TaxID=104777 RepID=A0A813XD90_9BILA|nr:unnamed protein product [Brachionus calyciflorus]
MRLSLAKKTELVQLYSSMVKPQRHLFRNLSILAAERGIIISEKSSKKIINYWLDTGLLFKKRTTLNGQKHCRVTIRQLKSVDRAIERNREVTSKFLKRRFGLAASERTVRRYINLLGWRYRKTKYCQAVTIKNRIERLFFCYMCTFTNDHFDDVIFIDETTIEVKYYSRQRWYKSYEGVPTRQRVGLYKHNAKIHVLAGISRKGATRPALFTGKLTSITFQALFDEYILPFIANNYPDNHRLYMDNDPKHSSFSTYRYFRRNFINHFPSPPQSPDLNPIEMIWNDLKYYLETFYKPSTINDLVYGINRFWDRKVNIDLCNSKINKLFSVVDRIVEFNGEASEF